MTEKKTTTSKAKKEVDVEPKKSERLVSFKEYFIGKAVRDETKAAIKARLNGKLYMTEKEWDEVLKNSI